MDLGPYKAALAAADRDHEDLVKEKPNKNCGDCKARIRMIFWMQQLQRDLRQVIGGEPVLTKIKEHRHK